MSARFVARSLAQGATRGYASQASIKPPLTLNGLPGKYASSAYVAALSKDARTLQKVETDLKAIQTTLAGSQGSKLEAVITNPTLSVQDRIKTLDQVFSESKEKPDPITHNLLSVLAENGRLADTPKVIQGFLQLMNAYRGEVEVTVTSATPLDKYAFSRLESALKSSQIAQNGGGKTLKITQKVNPSIQGGLVVDFGDSSIDLSVSNRVNQLNNMLAQGV
ncbi:putative ATP5-F1F0-ATPase complex, OSCP subunit [Tilletiaria anomala UBC 951]|uniref:ATP synthase subunit 5, mitochondrial n=1 Tax=Tilletiaria anomala (strain ATCC 24038 / CBS 436.72 / UBC 951) TaxID=1037660 RepID=A0A066WFR3_TILAU|nr:putative ATP5-F1F0-ATPase complex, OSCP subunit [Tilletiaria anomala UBC 951]KDN52812.1 putative ATP5-F1F0-ATPase complex, OSCP subunit [Tilletiaria anomala UBC 951]